MADIAWVILHGTLDDGGGETTCACGFEWGDTPAMVNTTGTQNRTAGQTFQQTIVAVLDTTYYFRAFATNSGYKGYGAILSFVISSISGAVTVAALPATNIAENHATINGYVVDSLTKYGSVRFQYGMTTAYGVTTPWQDGFFTGDEFHADLTSLAEGTAFHFRAQFRGSSIVSSSDMTFSTLSGVGMPVMVTEELLEVLTGVTL